MEMNIKKADAGRVLHLSFTSEELAENVEDFEGAPEVWAKSALMNLVAPFIRAFSDPSPLDAYTLERAFLIPTFQCRASYRAKDPLSAWKFTEVDADLWFSGKRLLDFRVEPKGKMSA